MLRPCKKTKKAVEYDADGDTKCNWHIWNDYPKPW